MKSPKTIEDRIKYMKELIQSKIDSFKADPSFKADKSRHGTLVSFEESLNRRERRTSNEAEYFIYL